MSDLMNFVQKSQWKKSITMDLHGLDFPLHKYTNVHEKNDNEENGRKWISEIHPKCVASTQILLGPTA